jgi:crotonobetainyl-CoA:carnitine CoA-transferase CaiB-like acyl-CoA transferase
VDAWAERFTSAGLPAGKVGSISEALDLAERLGLAPTVAVGDQHPPQVRSPLTFSETPITRYAPPPLLGEHNHEVRRQLTEEIN